MFDFHKYIETFNSGDEQAMVDNFWVDDLVVATSQSGNNNEGGIVAKGKEDWLKFLGLGTRYRLTRIRGRYVTTSAEILEKQTVYSLVEDEDHPLWRYLYKYGHSFPFVSTVYGNAAFQNADQGRRYLLSVGSSGFVVREIGE